MIVILNDLIFNPVTFIDLFTKDENSSPRS